VVALKGARADKLIAGLTGMDSEQQQLTLAKATGNFKRGNERPIDKRPVADLLEHPYTRGSQKTDPMPLGE
jgi:hypothetical protein